MKKSFSLLIALFFVVSCGGGGGGGAESSSAGTGWTGPVNTYNYPDVEGKYTFITTEFIGTCTDGSGGNVPAENDTLEIRQSAGDLVFYNLDSNGNLIYQAEQMTGKVDLAGNFNSYRDENTYITGWPGATTMKGYLNGKFTEKGWSGTMRLEMYNATRNGGCTLTSSFTGSSYATPTPTPTPTAPTAPTALVLTSATSSAVTLTWTASTDDVGVTGYDIYRDGAKVGTSTTANYIDATVTNSKIYSYTVKAKDAAGNISAASAMLSVTTPTPTSKAVFVVCNDGTYSFSCSNTCSSQGGVRHWYLSCGHTDIDW